jgi:hypothetical protein
MKLTKQSLTLLTLTIAIPFIAGMLLRGSAQTTSLNQRSATTGDDSTQVKIARAISAGRMNVASAAKIIDTDSQGKLVVLREGSNGFTCMPGNLKVVGEPPMCVDAAAMQWYDDAKAHKPKPTNTVPGITYMLAGATQRSDSDSQRHNEHANRNRSPLDDHVAVRSEDYRTADHSQADWCIHHVGGIAVRAFACHWTPIGVATSK